MRQLSSRTQAIAVTVIMELVRENVVPRWVGTMLSDVINNFVISSVSFVASVR